MPIMLMPSTSRATNDFVVLVSSSGDISCVDAISFKTYRKLRRPGDVSCVDAINFKTHEQLRWPGFIFRRRQLC
ncbi:hypothetical protein Taro_045287 [Colocasia esculenta]|uniref:Uncharacterized protein n=1 Tax=Colocasia esculenta TaxID=4460 RepID=A0A843X6D2_COLES|nr:hypothetical protein [Colocasia esculenta]